MRKILPVILFLCCLPAAAQTAEAPKRGFHEGPYLAFEVGALQNTFDKDIVDNVKVGNDFEPTFGFLFGWNLTDYFSMEMQGRYATNFNAGRREHIGAGAVFGKGTFISDALTSFKDFHILPFAKLGMSVRVTALPGATGAGNSVVASPGYGPAVGAGVAFLWHKYFYFGFDLQEEFLFFDDIAQTVNGTPGVLVYEGGFYPQFSGMVMLGVHY